jgi:hypothetical protein
MSHSALITLAAETTTASGGVNHWVVGITVFVVLLALIAGLLMFGAGRDHS